MKIKISFGQIQNVKCKGIHEYHLQSNGSYKFKTKVKTNENSKTCISLQCKCGNTLIFSILFYLSRVTY